MLKAHKPRNPEVEAILKTTAEQIENILHEPVLLEVYEPPFPLATIMAVVCDQLQVSEVAVTGKCRKEYIKDARHIACYLAQNTGCYSPHPNRPMAKLSRSYPRRSCLQAYKGYA